MSSGRATPPPAHGVVITAFRPAVRNALRGYADVAIPSDHLTIHGIAIFRAGDWCSIKLPGLTSRPQFFEVPPLFVDERGLRQFERAVLAALRAAYPHALADRERVA